MRGGGWSKKARKHSGATTFGVKKKQTKASRSIQEQQHKNTRQRGNCSKSVRGGAVKGPNSGDYKRGAASLKSGIEKDETGRQLEANQKNRQLERERGGKKQVRNGGDIPTRICFWGGEKTITGKHPVERTIQTATDRGSLGAPVFPRGKKGIK